MIKNDQEFLVEKIRTEYTEKEHTSLDELKRLDSKVKRPANIFGYVFGGVGAIVMGSGMSLVMTDIGASVGIRNTMAFGVIIGIMGMLMASINYPIYKRILVSRKEKYAAQVIAISNKIMKA